MGISLNVKLDLWSNWADTPFWISIADDALTFNWKLTLEFKNKLINIASQLGIGYHQTSANFFFLPLFPLIDKTEDIVIDDMIKQIIRLFDAIKLQSLNDGKTDGHASPAALESVHSE
jgi:hypothetical protein